MKTKFTLLIAILLLSLGVFAQAPDGVNYQAVVRNGLGLPLNTQTVSVRFTIHQGSPTGTPVFQEVQPDTTNQFGLINLQLGSINTAAFSAINWGTGGAYYLQIEVDVVGLGVFEDLGASQLLSVPYALFAKSAATGQQGFNSLIDTVAAPLATCPTGGYQVLIGLDTNANTVLDAIEVTSSFFVCNGSGGAGSNNDTSATNELQSLTTAGNNLNISGGTGTTISTTAPTIGDVLYWNGTDWVAQAPAPNTDNQILTYTSGTQNLAISNGNAVTLIVDDADNDPTNEIELPATAVLNQVLTWNGSAWVAQNAGAGADNWGSQVVITDVTLTGDGTAGTPLSGFDGNYTSLTGAPTNVSSFTNDAGYLTTFTEVDGSITNELQTISKTGSTVTLSNGGGSFNDDINDADFDPTNEIELPATAVLNQVLTWNGSAWVAQNAGAGADNWGSQVVITDVTLTGDGTAGTPLSGFDGNYTSLTGAPTNVSSFTNDAGYLTTFTEVDGSITNELQTISKTGSTVTLSNGGGSFNDDVNDADADATNEYNTAFWVNGANLELTDGGGTFSVPLSSLSPAVLWLTNGSDIYNSNVGNVGIGTNSPIFPLHVNTSTQDRAGYFINSTISNTATGKFGVYAIASGGGTGDNIGGWFDASGTGTGINFGVVGQALGTTAENRAVYGNASGGTTNWAGYFDLGNVYINNNLGIGSTTPGMVAGSTNYLTIASTGPYAAGSVAALELKGNTNSGNSTATRIDFLNGLGTNNIARIETMTSGVSTGEGQMLFYTNGGTLSEAMRITEDGNVGIGTTNPVGALDVNGEINNNARSGMANLVPIAYGQVGSGGTIANAGTGNWTVVFNGTGSYTVTVTGETITGSSHIVFLTLFGSSGFITYQAPFGTIIVSTDNTSGANANSSFNFIVYKQ